MTPSRNRLERPPKTKQEKQQNAKQADSQTTGSDNSQDNTDSKTETNSFIKAATGLAQKAKKHLNLAKADGSHDGQRDGMYQLGVVKGGDTDQAKSGKGTTDGETTTSEDDAAEKADDGNEDDKQDDDKSSTDRASAKNNNNKRDNGSVPATKPDSVKMPKRGDANYMSSSTMTGIKIDGVKAMEEYTASKLKGGADTYLGVLTLEDFAVSERLQFISSLDPFFELRTDEDTTTTIDSRHAIQYEGEIPPVKFASDKFKMGLSMLEFKVSQKTLPKLSALVDATSDIELINDSFARVMAAGVLEDSVHVASLYNNVVLKTGDDVDIKMPNTYASKKYPPVYNPAMPNPFLSTQLPPNIQRQAYDYEKTKAFSPTNTFKDGAYKISDIVDINACSELARILNYNYEECSERLFSTGEFVDIMAGKLSPNVSMEIDMSSKDYRKTTDLIRPTQEQTLTRVASISYLESAQLAYLQQLANVMSGGLQRYSTEGTINDVLMSRVSQLPTAYKADALNALVQTFVVSSHNNTSGAVTSLSQLNLLLASDLAFPYIATQLPTVRVPTGVYTPTTIMNIFRYVATGMLSLRQLYHDPDYATRWFYSLMMLFPPAEIQSIITNWHPEITQAPELKVRYTSFPTYMTTALPSTTIIGSIMRAMRQTYDETLRHTIRHQAAHSTWRNDTYLDQPIDINYYSGGVPLPISDYIPNVATTATYVLIKALFDYILNHVTVAASGNTSGSKVVKAALHSFITELCSSVVLAMGVKYDVAKALVRAGLLNIDNTDYQTTLSPPIIPAVHIEGNALGIFMNRLRVSANPTMVGQMLIPLYISTDAVTNHEFQASVRYYTLMLDLVTQYETLRNIDNYSHNSDAVSAFLALTTALYLWNDRGKLGNIAKIAVGGQRTTSGFNDLMRMLSPTSTDVLNIHGGSCSRVDFRGEGASLVQTNAVTSLRVDGSDVKMSPSEFTLMVIREIGNFVDEEMLSVVSPTAVGVLLSAYDDMYIPESLDNELAPPILAGTIENLGNAVVDVAGDMHTKALRYIDPNGDEQQIGLLELAEFSNPPLTFEVIQIGYMSPLHSSYLGKCIVRGNLALYIPNKKVGIVVENVLADTEPERTSIEMDDAKLVERILGSADTDVTVHRLKRRIRTPFQPPDVIATLIRKLVDMDVSNSTANIIGAKWQNDTTTAEFRPELFYPTRVLTRASIHDPVDYEGNHKHQIKPTCLINPVMRINSSSVYAVNDLLDQLTATTYV
jgi:hypothetical protein